MTIASAITAAQGRVADCYTSVSTMGGTIPATQNLTNLPTAIESIPTGGGGGDTIYLKNKSSKATLLSGDKVLFTLGTVGDGDTYDFTRTLIGSTLNPPIFFDNFSLVVSDSQSGNLYSYINNEWTQEPSSSIYADWATYATYQCFDDAVSYYGNVGYSYYSGIVTKDSRKNVYSSDNRNQYMGKYSERYAYYAYDVGVYIWDLANNTSTALFSNAGIGGARFARLFGTKMIYQGDNNCKIYELTSSSTFTMLLNQPLSERILFATGLDEGDYLLTTDNYSAYTNTSSTPVTAHLICYRMKNGMIEYVQDPVLSMFENTSCFVAYDNRSNILSIGTKDNVYFFEFDSTTKQFSPLNVIIQSSAFPVTINDFPYKTMMSPDKTQVVILGRNQSLSTFYINVISLLSTDKAIVDNSQYNYNITTSFTGFATGQTDSSGKYEVSTVLPEVVTSYLLTDLEPDEAIFEGVVEQ